MAGTTHPTAVIHPGAIIGEGAEIGPFAVVEDGAAIGEHCRLGAYATVRSGVTMGAGNVVENFAVIGDLPQHLGYAGEDTRVVVGSGNTFREYVTVHRATAAGGGVTRIGDGCHFMALSHVAHDSHLGNGVTLENGVQMGGHTVIGDGTVIGALTAIHQFVTIGAGCRVEVMSAVAQDVTPYTLAGGDRATRRGINEEWLAAAGVPEARLVSLRRAMELVFASNLTLEAALAAIREEGLEGAETAGFVDFLGKSHRGFCR